MKNTKDKSAVEEKISLGDSVLDEWTDKDIPPKIGVVMEYMPKASAFPYIVYWNTGQQWEYDHNEILEMNAAYEKYRDH